MASKTSSVEGQSALCGPLSLVSRAGERATVVLGVVGSIEISAGVLRKALSAVPGHVLDSKERSIRAQEHVQVTAADDRVVCVLNNALQNSICCRWRRGIRSTAAVVAIAEDVDVGALEPVGVYVSVESLLDVGAIEVDLGAWRRVVSRVDYAQLAVRVRACLCDVVDVEAGVDLKYRCIESIKHIAGVGLGGVRVRENRELFLRRRELEVGVQVRGVVARILTLSNSLHKSLVEIEEVLPELDVWQEYNLLLNCPVSDNGIVDRDASQVEVVLIIGRNETISDVWHIVTVVC